MIPDPDNDNKKCGGVGSPDRVFKLNKSWVTIENCRSRCAGDQSCVAMSGIWGPNEKWCIGCNVTLNAAHPSAKAFRKGRN